MLRYCASNILASASRVSAVRNISTSALKLENTRPEASDVDKLFSDNTQPKRRSAFNINRVELMGGVADQPTARVSRNGSEYVTFSLFTNVDFKKGDGSFGEHVELHHIHVFGGQANFVKNNVEKGNRVLVIGRLHYEGGQIRPDGTRSPRNTSITAESIVPVSRRVQSTDS